MFRIIKNSLFLFLVGCSSHSFVPEISQSDLRTQIEYLASDQLEGRRTGTDGETLATEYVSNLLQDWGFSPLSDSSSLFSSFQFVSGVEQGDRNKFILSTPSNSSLAGKLNTDWSPLGLSSSGEFKGEQIYFVGYGLSSSQNEGAFSYDSYAHLDVRDKWVALLKFWPEEISNSQLSDTLRSQSNLRFKISAARDRGAKGVIVLSSSSDDTRSELIPFNNFGDGVQSSIPAISLNQNFSRALFDGSGFDLDTLHADLRGGRLVQGILLKSQIAELSTDVRIVRRQGRNVVGTIQARDPENDEAILIGAHIDHLGRGDLSNSLATEDEHGKIHYGADDNASGVAAVLEISQQIAEQVRADKLKLKRDLIVAFWSGEELGLLGSSAFAESITGKKIAGRKIVAALNLDMVGRLGTSLVVQGVGSSESWDRVVDQMQSSSEVDLIKQRDSFLPTDSLSFYNLGIPVLSFFTGVHQEYHTPRDTPDLINYVGLKEVSSLVLGLTTDLLVAPHLDIPFRQAESPHNFNVRGGFRAYFGTVPDYSSREASGVRISGVSHGSPAEQAGLQKNDVITKVDKVRIENIYDYTAILQKLRVGSVVEIEIERSGEKLSRKIKVGSRD